MRFRKYDTYIWFPLLLLWWRSDYGTSFKSVKKGLEHLVISKRFRRKASGILIRRNTVPLKTIYGFKSFNHQGSNCQY